MRIPDGVAIIKIKSRSQADTMSASIAQFMMRGGEGQPSIQCNYGTDSFVSQQIWNSKHNQLMVLMRDWFESGADTFPGNMPYSTGIQTVKYTVPSTDFIRDGLMLYFGQGDIHPEMLGSFLLQYEGTINPDTNEVCFKGRIYNAWSVESLTRNPNSRKPLVSGDYSKVHMVIEIEHTRPKQTKHPLSR